MTTTSEPHRPAPEQSAPTGPGADRPAGNSDTFVFWLIVLLAPVGQMAIDIFVPSLPTLVDEFDTSRGAIQLSVSLYLVAFAAGQLLYGPLADARGRKAALLTGVGLYLVGSVLTLVADSVALFVTARIVQGLGITAASVLMKVIPADRFSGPKLTQVMTWMVISWGLGPILAPVIGAWFEMGPGWRYSLYFLTGYGLLLFALIAFVFKETHHDRQPFSLRSLAADARSVMTDAEFTRLYLCMGLCFAVLLTFNLVGPFLVQDVMGYSAGVYGLIALAMGAAYFSGTFSNRVLPASFTTRRKFRTASLVTVLASVAMVVTAALTPPNLWSLTLPSLVIVFFTGMMYPNLMAAGISRFPHVAGLVSSLLGCSLMLISGLVTIGSSLLKADTLLPVALLFTGCMVICRILLLRTLASRQEG
ncbi:multidrug effflux MFS transporter [Streptomyces sp. NPDC006879]|uniref:multidrug effflux MFS transporter n=1 Tax=Streptomyces sp. NPDC006879 TaxID=3364767 RepID=UPI00369E4C71